MNRAINLYAHHKRLNPEKYAPSREAFEVDPTGLQRMDVLEKSDKMKANIHSVKYIPLQLDFNPQVWHTPHVSVPVGSMENRMEEKKEEPEIQNSTPKQKRKQKNPRQIRDGIKYHPIKSKSDYPHFERPVLRRIDPISDRTLLAMSEMQ